MRRFPDALASGLVAIVTACTGTTVERQPVAAAFEKSRALMVDEQIAARDIKNPVVLEAMRRVPRHEFVPEPLRGSAYADSPLPIGHDQTISQPYIVAYMTEALELDRSHRVLEIGTGSGYQAAVLGEIAKEVYTIEIVAPLAEGARAILKQLGWLK